MYARRARRSLFLIAIGLVSGALLVTIVGVVAGGDASTLSEMIPFRTDYSLLRARWLYLPGLRLDDKRVRDLYGQAVRQYLGSHPELAGIVSDRVVVFAIEDALYPSTLGPEFELLTASEIQDRAQLEGTTAYLLASVEDSTLRSLVVRIAVAHEHKSPYVFSALEAQTSFTCSRSFGEWRCAEKPTSN